MTREFYYNNMPDISDAKLEREFILWLISLDLSDENARRACHYITEIKSDERAEKRPLIDVIEQLLHIIDSEISKKTQVTYIGEITNAKKILKDYF